MFGTISDEREVSVAADDAWKLYGTLKLAKLVEKSLPNVLSKIDVVQGDGGPGTILHLFPHPAPGTNEVMSYKEKFTVVDEEKRVKETEVVEGGLLNLGFTLFRVRFEIIEKEGVEDECITRATVEYEIKEEDAANSSYVSIQTFSTIMQCAADYLLSCKSS